MKCKDFHRHAGFLDGFLNMHTEHQFYTCVCVCARLERIEAHNYATTWRAIKTIQRAHTQTHICICMVLTHMKLVSGLHEYLKCSANELHKIFISISFSLPFPLSLSVHLHCMPTFYYSCYLLTILYYT